DSYSITEVYTAFPDFDEQTIIYTDEWGIGRRRMNLAKVFNVVVPFNNYENIGNALCDLDEVLYVDPLLGAGRDMKRSIKNTDERILTNDYYFATLPRQLYLDDPANEDDDPETLDGTDINAPEAWDIYTGYGPNPNGEEDEGYHEKDYIQIGFFESGGVNTNHEDLKPAPGSPHGDGSQDGSRRVGDHGTYVAGIAAGRTNNQDGISGIDWNSETFVTACEATDKPRAWYQQTYPNSWQREMSHHLNLLIGRREGNDVRCQIVNVCTYWDHAVSSVVEQYNNVYKANTTIVASAGNVSEAELQNVHMPATNFIHTVINVGGTSYRENMWDDVASRSDFMDVAAPCDQIVSTDVDGTYRILSSGTSFSTPLVSGLAALLAGYYKETHTTVENDVIEMEDMHCEDIQNIIRYSAKLPEDEPGNAIQEDGPLDIMVGEKPWNDYVGCGQIDMQAALNYLNDPWELRHFTYNYGDENERVTTSYWDWEHNAQNGNYHPIYKLKGVPGFQDGTSRARRAKVTIYVDVDPGYEYYVWGRGAPGDQDLGTLGYYRINPCWQLEDGRGGIADGNNVYDVPFTLASKRNGVSSIVVSTWVYQELGGGRNWYPCSPEDVRFAWTVLFNTIPLDAPYVSEHIPDIYFLDACYPNPFNSGTMLSYYVNVPSVVNLSLFDTNGRLIQEVFKDQKLPGKYRYPVSLNHLPTGTYLLRLSNPSEMSMQKITLVK
ncbi:MAG: S8 family serine peptidase, partial [Candidatus Hatepunaea meridiana]|nr:S8 family serine peptidase [Candidatus Hatepunaea meridiana]